LSAYPGAQYILIQPNGFAQQVINHFVRVGIQIICHYIRPALAAASNMSYKVGRLVKQPD